MNRFFRTAYATTLVYLLLTLVAVLIARVGMPFLAFSCLYFGLLLCLLPGALPGLNGKERLFSCVGAAIAVLGFLPLALWRCPTIHWATYLLGIAAAAAFLSLLRHRTTHADFMAKCRFTVVLLLILIGFVYLALLMGIYQDGQVSERSEILRLATNNVVPYATVLLVSGVLLLRGLRAQEGVVDERAFNRRQLRDTLIFATLVTVVFAIDPFMYLQRAALFLFTDVLRPAARFLVQFLDLLLRLMARKKPPTAEEPLPTPEATQEAGEMPVTELTEREPERYYVDGKDLSLTIAYIFLAAAALILLLILAFQIRKLVRNLQKRNQYHGSGYPNETREALPEKEETYRRGKPKRGSADPRERMRYLYGEYLRHLKKLLVRFDRTDTCGEIQRHAHRNLLLDSSLLFEFTALYEKARYRLKKTPTEADAHRMKNLLDRIKKGS